MIFRAPFIYILCLMFSFSFGEIPKYNSRALATKTHPGHDIISLRPDSVKIAIGGMDFLSDGRLVVCTWDGNHGDVRDIQKGDVFIFEGVLGNDPSQVTVTEIASDLDDPLGVKVVDDRIFVLLTLELVELVKNQAGEYEKRVVNSLDYGHSRHEFQFGLSYKKPYFYGTASTAQRVDHVNPNRGTAWKIHEDTGERTYLATGLREPNGVCLGLDGAMYVTDNKGNSPLIRIEQGSYYGYEWKVLDPALQEFTKTPYTIEYPYGKLGKSPSEPIAIPEGMFAGQFYSGDVTWNGIRRGQVEVVDGTYQGAAFPWLTVDNSAVNRLAWGPDGNLYAGSIGQPGNWPKKRNGFSPLVRIEPTGITAFEMKSINIRSDGFRISFTTPIDPAYANKENFTLEKVVQKGDGTLEYEVVYEEQTGDVLLKNDLSSQNLYMIEASPEVSSVSGEKILHTTAYYTVNKAGNGLPVGVDPNFKNQRLTEKNVKLSKMGSVLLVESNFKQPYSIEFLTVKGSKIKVFEGEGKGVHSLHLPPTPSMLIMHAHSEGKTQVEKIPVYPTH